MLSSPVSLDDLKILPAISLWKGDWAPSMENEYDYVDTMKSFHKQIAVGTVYRAVLANGTEVSEFEPFVRCSEICLECTNLYKTDLPAQLVKH